MRFVFLFVRARKSESFTMMEVCTLHIRRIGKRSEVLVETWKQVFWSCVKKVGDCWNWMGGFNRGNGFCWFSYWGKVIIVVRVVWELMHGEIPLG